MAARKNKRGRNLIIVLSIITLLLMGGLVFAKQKGWVGQERFTKVAVEEVKTRTITEIVSASGKIYPEVEVKVASDVSGEILQLSIEEGDSVKKGALLAKVEPDIYNTAVERAEASVNSAKSNMANSKAQIMQLETQLTQAERIYQRNQELFKEDLLPLATLQDSETQLNALKAQIQASNELLEGSGYGVKSAEATLKEAQKSLRKTNIYAPMSGIVSTLNVKQGERVVGTAQFEGTELMRISNFDNMELQVDVSENDVVKVKERDSVKIEIDAYVDRIFEGVVTQISNSTATSALMSNDQVTNFKVKIRLLQSSYQDLLDSGSNFPFRPGMSASADIETKKLTDILAVPIQSVTTREIPDSLKKDNGKDDDLLEVVFVVGSDDKIIQKEVKTGIQDDTYIEVKEGVDKGDRLITAPYREISKKLEDEQQVEVVDKEKLFQKKSKK